MESVVGWLLGLGVFFGAVAALFVAFRQGTRAVFGPRRRLEEELGIDVLRHRLDRGEISQQEFDDAKRTLGH